MKWFNLEILGWCLMSPAIVARFPGRIADAIMHKGQVLP